MPPAALYGQNAEKSIDFRLSFAPYATGKGFLKSRFAT